MLHHVKTILSVSVWFLIVSPTPSQSLFNYVGMISWAQGGRELGGPISGGRKGNNSGLITSQQKQRKKSYIKQVINIKHAVL